MKELSSKFLFLSICLAAFFFEKAIMAEVMDERTQPYYKDLTDTDLISVVENSITCHQEMDNGDGTFYDKILFQDCGNTTPTYYYEESGLIDDYENYEFTFTDDCREVAYQCLLEDMVLLETFAEVVSNMSEVEKKSAEKAYSVPFNYIEKDVDIRKIIVKCVEERNVDQQWFFGGSSITCEDAIDTSE